MALDLGVTYAGQIDPDTAAYPYGKPRNVTVPGDGLGTPLEKAWVQDVYGFLHRLLIESGIVPSGTADNATDLTSSQYLLALKAILLDRVELDTSPVLDDAAPGTPIIQIVGNRHPRHFMTGYKQNWVSGTTISFAAGQCKSKAGGHDIDAGGFGTEKLVNATWAAGDGVGGVAAGALPLSAGWLAAFVVNKANGDTDFIWDDNVAATNVLADPAIITAGYDGLTTHRMVGWHYYDGAVFPEFHQHIEQERRFRWDTVKQISVGSISSNPREKFILPHAPPNTLVDLAIHLNWDSADGQVLFTELDQTDGAVTFSNSTVINGPGGLIQNIVMTMRTGPEGEIYARRDNNTVDSLRIGVLGWDFPQGQII